MKKSIAVKDILIGEGSPKICVPIIGENLDQIIDEAVQIKTLGPDLAEWRVDFFQDVEDIDKVAKALKKIHEILTPIPIIFTFRSAKEGGEKEVSLEYYTELNKAMIETGLADIVDVELFCGEEIVTEVVRFAHTYNVFVIISNHDFEKTPSKEEIVKRLRKAQELGGDLPKIAVMPATSNDVLTLLDATITMHDQYADRPIITMSMAGKGVVSRLSGEIFGSSITFGAAKKASAPGQIAVSELRQILNLLHLNM
ncbi:type I 3-dehydroquinate dehydratase [Bacillus sp. S/N-304-OC-R1]|uniref:type I 3-dehydroquinate dehydratase n=1 Tax=Bacillus sp. S/N-304-OC-R1 TaxID=2758034 RepID=UPI001C8D7CD5|nr:type I 3-dehydroquinate dehydratase [Bacillus sp. S/N-304-OC-R1]MBY0123932.1 type I 3-dehydroquinate dehydratase [Bacillus sp. S/N-304-OC-R1]